MENQSSMLFYPVYLMKLEVGGLAAGINNEFTAYSIVQAEKEV